MVRKFKSVTASPTEIAAIEAAIAGVMGTSKPKAEPELTAAQRGALERQSGTIGFRPTEPSGLRSEDPRGDVDASSWIIGHAELRELGTDRKGAVWFKAPERIEQLAPYEFTLDLSESYLEDDPRRASTGVWIAGPDGGYVGARRWPGGTFDILMGGRTPAKASRPRPADALAGMALLSGRQGYGPANGRDAITPNPETILARARRLGATITASADGTHLLVLGDRGHVDPRVTDAVERARPLLLAHLAGTPLRCAYDHAEPEGAPIASTLSVGGAPLCSVTTHEAQPEPARAGKVDRIKAAVGIGA